MIVYFLVAIIVGALSLCYEHSKKLTNEKTSRIVKFSSVFLLILILSTIFALRGMSVGTDTGSYYHIFKYIGSNFKYLFDYEIGYTFLSIIIFALTGNFQVFMFVIGIIMFSCIIFSTIKMSKNITLSNILFITSGFYMQSFNLVRQYMALALLMVGLYFLISKNNLKLYLLFLIIAILFHKTAMFGLVFILMKYIKFDTANVLIACLLTLVGIYLLPIVGPIFDKVLNVSYFSSYKHLVVDMLSTLNIFYFAISVIIITLLLFFKKKVEDKKISIDMKMVDLYSWMIVLFCLIKIISAFTIENIGRIGLYFMFPIILFIPFIIENFFKNKRVWNGVVILGSVIFMFVLIQVMGAYGVYPYKFI